MTRQLRVALRGAVETASIRTAAFEGREHVVVPVVALIGDAVITAMNSEGPELVPADELAVAPMAWNGRPVLPDHPDSGRGSANEPRVLEAFAFGRMFNTVFEDGKLKTEAWLDPARAERVGEDAVSVIERCRRREPVEVSVGAYVRVDDIKGRNAEGKEYTKVWRDIKPDHLAMLPEGARGACSIEMGCGAPRAAGDQEVKDVRMNVTVNGMNLLGRVLSAIGVKRTAEEGQSDLDLRRLLYDALRADEPGFIDVMEVYPDDGLVVYFVAPEDRWIHYRRAYTLDGSTVTLGDKVEVEPILRWEPVAAADSSQPAVARAACGCQPNNGDGASEPQAKDKEGAQMSKVATLAAALIACAQSPFEDGDKATLEGLGEAKLEALSKRFAAEGGDPAQPATPPAPQNPPAPSPAPTPNPAPAPTPNPAPKAEAQAEPTEEEAIAKMPASLREIINSHRAAQAARKTELVTKLASAQDGYTKAELEAKGNDELEKLARAFRVDQPVPAHYGGRVLAAPSGGPDEYDVTNPPDSYGLAALEAARNGGQTKGA